MELIQTLITWIFCYFRPAIKWFLRQTTRLCELQRICYGEAPGAQRTCAVGKYIRFFVQTLSTFFLTTQISSSMFLMEIVIVSKETYIAFSTKPLNYA